MKANSALEVPIMVALQRCGVGESLSQHDVVELCTLGLTGAEQVIEENPQHFRSCRGRLEGVGEDRTNSRLLGSS